MVAQLHTSLSGMVAQPNTSLSGMVAQLNTSLNSALSLGKCSVAHRGSGLVASLTYLYALKERKKRNVLPLTANEHHLLRDLADYLIIMLTELTSPSVPGPYGDRQLSKQFMLGLANFFDF
jgi:hypothetical protein